MTVGIAAADHNGRFESRGSFKLAKQTIIFQQDLQV
jgi:hypothetical protein